jgi:hypothetical protein
MRVSRSLHFAGLIVSLALAGGCGAKDVAPPSPRPADGPWSTHAAGFGLVLDLTWDQSSVHGTGTYAVAGAILGCGGATLHGTGSVTFSATRSAAGDIVGGMVFDNGWTPVYQGTLASETHVQGGFRSVDSGLCALDLFDGLVP